jgi:serine-type D-Ala-D-Ala carboxypeptidase/endopeptidase
MQKIFVFILVLTIVSCKKNIEIPETNIEKFNNPLSNGIDSAVHSAYLKHKDSVNTVGMSIGLYKGGKIYYYGYGETVKGNNTPPNEKTFFEIGSITKTYTAIATQLMLLEKNQAINQPIRVSLPDSIPVLEKEGVEVTFKHLINHTSGIPYFPGNFDNFNTAEELAESIKTYDKNKLLSFLKQNPLLFKP